jgi:two-component system, chemotaxis family, protein-glutamate methylesterase/glutaminase
MTPSSSPTKVRVVVVEDSLVQRAHLVETLEADGDISIVGQATTADEGIALVARTRPDVVTLDLQLPDHNGNYVIEQIMANTPTAILVLSATVNGPQSAPAIEALVRGALDALPKPQRWTAEHEVKLRRSVRTLAKVTVIRHHKGRPAIRPGGPALPAPVASPVVALAASTGGPAALAEVLAGLGGLAAPVLVVQHIHADFVAGLVSWMARVSALPVRLARHGELLVNGHVYIGPGDVHLHLGSGGRIALASHPATVHRPSADELFRSVAEHAGPAGVGVLLTGMGSDGANGLLALRNRGGHTLAQDEASCAVFGMPKAAYLLGAVSDVVALEDIAATVVRAVQDMRS